MHSRLAISEALRHVQPLDSGRIYCFSTLNFPLQGLDIRCQSNIKAKTPWLWRDWLVEEVGRHGGHILLGFVVGVFLLPLLLILDLNHRFFGLLFPAVGLESIFGEILTDHEVCVGLISFGFGRLSNYVIFFQCLLNFRNPLNGQQFRRPPKIRVRNIEGESLLTCNSWMAHFV